VHVISTITFELLALFISQNVCDWLLNKYSDAQNVVICQTSAADKSVITPQVVEARGNIPQVAKAWVILLMIARYRG